ncbi:hypothetical protein [Campylobacter helveticus]|uniref:hypothetical protein n=1 Tax=Campylobacter helveticus TaxID=28898 RepID=UPI0009C3851F|nr:hypothetical protein [Campylobacter helveticus]ARE80305.1 hypothetical protein CHELV3228_0695 [Campylobacter helveticus]MCR2055702.1 hypothetical protein [Campylobacter helveticus]MCR2061159.1 hypothetical protein [Campylobacter helveticus]TNB55019.1 hypothetical protein FDW44_09805 [Campylobacter helveticus]TNH31931.1 hypothetical protein FDW48_09215 [Campylobacter helveticus]
MKNKLYHYFNHKEKPNDFKKQFFKNIKQTLFYLFLAILTFYNITYLTLLTFSPFPFFGWISLFILSTIWVYLFLKLVFYLIFKLFNIDKKIKKFYLFLPYPLFMIAWFSYSFVPLEWQSSFKEFENLCKNLKDKEVIYNQEVYDRVKGKNNVVKVKFVESNMGLRIQKVEYQYYEIATNVLYKSYYTYGWLDIGMFAKNGRTLGCDGIDEYKKKIKERDY